MIDTRPSARSVPDLPTVQVAEASPSMRAVLRVSNPLIAANPEQDMPSQPALRMVSQAPPG